MDGPPHRPRPLQVECYRVGAVPGRAGFFAYIAYDIDLFEAGSIANLTFSIIGNVFGFKAVKALRLEDMRIPVAYVKTFQGPRCLRRGPARRPRLHLGRREHQQPAVHALARPVPARHGAVNRAQQMTGEIKGHYLNGAAGPMADMYERAAFAKELGTVIIMIDMALQVWGDIT